MGEAEELYAHFSPTRVLMGSSDDCNFHITSLHLPLADPIISHQTKVQNRYMGCGWGNPSLEADVSMFQRLMHIRLVRDLPSVRTPIPNSAPAKPVTTDSCTP